MRPSSLWRQACLSTLPIMFGYIPLSMAFAVMWMQNGLPAIWAIVSSIFLYAGSMQFLLAGLLVNDTDITAVALATVAVNLRLIFYGFSYPTAAFRGKPLQLVYGIFALTDEVYSLIAPMGRNADARLIWRMEALCHLYWLIGTSVGLLAGQLIPPQIVGFDFALVALFLILAQGHFYYRQRRMALILGLAAILLALGTVSQNNILAAAIAFLLLFLSFYPRKEKS
ncbi:MAG: AzlC family ABC transporter permease [Cardiobacteriaceae bacterium]|nr:AzlC family ABC transporter permease [Cardiobacteriaceae bacterium]